MDGIDSGSYLAWGFVIHNAEPSASIARKFIYSFLWSSRCCTEWRRWLSFREGLIHSSLFRLLLPPVSYLYTLAEL